MNAMIAQVSLLLASDPAGVSVADVAGTFDLSDRKARRLLSYGKAHGVFAEARARHNQGRWALTTLDAALTVSGGAPTSEEEIRARLRRRSSFPFCSKNDMTKNLETGTIEKGLRTKRKSTFPPKGEHLSLPRATPVPRFPEDGCRDRVLALERLWTAGTRNADHAPSRRSMFASPRPWLGDAKQVRRWNQFVLLDARLREWGVDPREFIAAAMGYFRRFKRGFAPNVQHVIGTVGRQVWESWRRKEHEKGGGAYLDPRCGVAGGEIRVRAAALTVVRSEKAAIELEMRRAYAECREHGVEWAVTLAWRPEVAWALWAAEPAARTVFRERLAEPVGDADRAELVRCWRGGVAAIERGPAARRAALRRVRDRVAGRVTPVLVAAPSIVVPTNGRTGVTVRGLDGKVHDARDFLCGT